MTTPLFAGTARRIISPPKGIYLIGYGDRLRGNLGIHDELTATALALSDGRTQATLIACDLLAINEQTAARVQAQAGPHLLICCSHTHSGPIVYADERSARKNQRYVDFLVAQLVEAARAAQANLQPAQLTYSRGEAGIAVNRRQRMADGRIEIGVHPGGVVDRSLQVVQVQTPAGQPLAQVVNFSCHNTVRGPKNLQVSADWAGAMRRKVEAQSGAPLLFVQGATADLNPAHEWGEKDDEAAERLGGQVAEAVLAALAESAPIEGLPLQFEARPLWIPLEAAANTPEPPTTYKSVLAKVARLPRFLVDPVLKQRYPWKTVIEARDGFWSSPMQLNFLRLGELALAALGMEVFNEIGLAIKARSPSRHTLVASVSNGCVGYLPTAAEHALGGYEVDLSPYFYRLPGRLAAESEALVLEAVQETLETMRS